MMTRLLCLLPITVVACGSQADNDTYYGEAMLSLRGEVLLEGIAPNTELVPALAFAEFETDALDVATSFAIVDVEAEGQFPTGFEMQVYSPPPDTALVSLRHFASMVPALANTDVKLGVGRIAAVRANHPESIKPATVTEEDVVCLDHACYLSWSRCAAKQCERKVYQCAPASPPGLEGCTQRVTGEIADLRFDDSFSSYGSLGCSATECIYEEAICGVDQMCVTFEYSCPLDHPVSGSAPPTVLNPTTEDPSEEPAAAEQPEDEPTESKPSAVFPRDRSSDPTSLAELSDCQIVSQQGESVEEASVASVIFGVSTVHTVVYLTGELEVPAKDLPVGFPRQAGYTVFVENPEYLLDDNCSFRAYDEALATVNARHGTDHGRGELPAEQQDEFNREVILSRACPAPTIPVDITKSPLTIPVGNVSEADEIFAW